MSNTNEIKNKKSKWSIIAEAFVITTVVCLFFTFCLGVYRKAGMTKLDHSAYDSYTLQAMAWRNGEVKLDKNYPWLELAIVNDEWFATHDKDDYMAYRETFGDINQTIEDMEGNEYYVSFPPFPSVPMYFLTFFFGENTPNTFMGVLYTTLAFLFAILLARRLKLNLLLSICAGFFTTLASSAFFIGVNKMAGGVWFQAQSLAIFLTVAAFYCIHGEKKWENYLAFFLLALAVGCRPFEILYFFYFAYVMAKKYDFRILKTWKYYISPALVGGVYMWYNYIRFGNPIEFGHNYLPEFMREPAGQFGLEYLKKNFHDIMTGVPKYENGKLEFSAFGFAFYASNVIFMVLAVLLCAYIIYTCFHAIYNLIYAKKSKEKGIAVTAEFKLFSVKNSQLIEVLLLIVLMSVHFFVTLLHKTLGAWQFGSRYTADIIPACITCCALIYNGLKRSSSAVRLSVAGYEMKALPKKAGRYIDTAFYGVLFVILFIILVRGSFINVYGTYLMFK